MSRPRKSPDGLPFRVYERRGKNKYNIFYKLPTGLLAFSYSCSVKNSEAIRDLRNKGIQESTLINSLERRLDEGDGFGLTTTLIKDWLNFQNSLPLTSSSRLAESTLKENENESKNLIKAFGHMNPDLIDRADGYEYIDLCAQANRSAKANKELSLMTKIFEWGVKRRYLKNNPFSGLDKPKTKHSMRLVTEDEILLALEVGRQMGSSQYIVALALTTAYLCVRRSVEIRSLQPSHIQDDGIVWNDGKDPDKASIIIEWSPALRSIVDEALAVPRKNRAQAPFVFGNLQGQRYTKGGWKSTLAKLMDECEVVAKERKMKFTKFSLQDCRPAGLTQKLKQGHTDSKDAMGHTTDRMIAAHYDRRIEKFAKPVR